MDQAQHFTGTASAAARSGGDEVGAEFRSGLDAAERECESCSIALLSIMMVTVTFHLQNMVLFPHNVCIGMHVGLVSLLYVWLDPGIACMWWLTTVEFGFSTVNAVFVIAQENSRQVKAWYESVDKVR